MNRSRKFLKPFIFVLLILIVCIAAIVLITGDEEPLIQTINNTETSQKISEQSSNKSQSQTQESNNSVSESAEPAKEESAKPSKQEISTAESQSAAEQNSPAEHPSTQAVTNITSENEMRAVWITYLTLDMEETDRSESAFKNKIDNIITTCQECHLNTIIVQVRPFGDSIYESDYFPFSHIISGKQGETVDYDALQYIVAAAHAHGLSVHAWVNPFRISTGKTPDTLADSNPYVQWLNDNDDFNDDYTFEYKGGIYYNPAYPEVRKLIIDGISEIVQKYDVDGIQLDDYFYPSDEPNYDSQTYQAYIDTVSSGSTVLSQSEWRKTNINLLVSGIYDAVHAVKKNVVFGIAPQCNFENNEEISADIKTWCSSKGYIDYICPQIYVSNQHPTFPFEVLAKQWKETVTENSVKLYFGLGVYKAGTDADDGTWLLNDDNLKTQIELSRTLDTDGFMLYSYDYLKSNDTKKEMENALSVIN